MCWTVLLKKKHYCAFPQEARDTTGTSCLPRPVLSTATTRIIDITHTIVPFIVVWIWAKKFQVREVKKKCLFLKRPLQCETRINWLCFMFIFIFIFRRFFILTGGVKSVSRENGTTGGGVGLGSGGAVTCKPVVPRELAQDFSRPPRLDILLDMPPASREMQIHHSWNADDRSLNIFVKVRVINLLG